MFAIYNNKMACKTLSKLLLVASVLMLCSCTKKTLPITQTNTTLDFKDEQNDVWIAQKYAKKLGVKTELVAKNIRLYQYVNSWENGPCFKELPKKDGTQDEKAYDPSWFYEKTIEEVFNLKIKSAKSFEELEERKMFLFYGKNYLSEGDILYFSSYNINIEADPSLVKRKYDLVAAGVYLINNYFLTCNNKERKIKIVNLSDPWKGDTLRTSWSRHFIAAERALQEK